MGVLMKRAVFLSLILALAIMPLIAHALSPLVKNLGPTVNGKNVDFAPVVSPDGNYLFFASDREGGQGGQDIWVSGKNDQGEWDRPVNLGPPVNTKLNQGPDCFFSENGKDYLYLTFCNPAGEGLCDLYLSQKNPKDGSWGAPEKLPAPINSEYSDANATWDYKNNILYFSSTRPGGMSGKEEGGPKIQRGSASYDIWRCPRNADGGWGKPEPLPAPVNTNKWEGVAFFHVASGWLYFSSNGHKAGDDADIYRTHEVSAGKWSEPEPVDAVNTSGNDMYFSIPAAGDLAYFSSDARESALKGLGLQDIYVVPLDLILSPEQLASRTMQLPATKKTPAGPGAGHIETIYFDFDRSNIRPSEVEKLNKVRDFLNENPTAKIEVAGHACSVGSDAYNMTLSKDRSQAVFQWLMRNKINPDRMTVTHYGETRPAEPNDPVHGNPLNRRVEISIKQ